MDREHVITSLIISVIISYFFSASVIPCRIVYSLRLQIRVLLFFIKGVRGV